MKNIKKKKIIRLFLITALAGYVCAYYTYDVHGEQNPRKSENVLPGEIKLTADAIHPFWRTDAFPKNNMEVDANPVSFYWPSQRREFTQPLKRYDFQLSSKEDFSIIEEQSEGQNPSFYVTVKPLAQGKWFWRYREEGKSWQGPFSFVVTENTRLDERPSAKVFVEAVGGDRPRMLMRKSRIPVVKEMFRKDGTTESIVKEAEKYFGVELPDKEWGGKFYKNGQRVFHNNKFPEDHIKSKITSGTWHNAIQALCRAYLLTGDEKYAKEALRWGLKVCSFDIMPNVLTYDNNPYPDGFCFAFYMNSVANIYDCLYDYMTPEQRETVRKNLAERLRYYYEYYCNRLENRCIDNHSWQISIAAFTRGAITAKGDIPEADKYLAYVYNIWTAIDPEQSRTDGGWFGGGYVAVNIDVWLEVPAYFRMFTGYNYYNTPFYKNHPYYFLYRQAPGSVEDGFSGDGYGGNGKGLGDKLRMWMGVLGVELNHPVANWLGSFEGGKKANKFDKVGWVRLTEGRPLKVDGVVKSPENLPQSRDFRDIGVVNMHTDLLHPANDLHVALRSSPYGTFGHNLASHNAFNVVYKGEYLFVPYGHRHGGAKNSAVCYRNSRGHNTVLIDGKGQPFSPEAYGWIPRFLNGEKLSYACGDASNAYDAAPFDRETGAFVAAGLKIDDYISRGVMKRFRRHVVLLRPSLILVYDELEAKQPVRWDWMLHCRYNMLADGSVLTVEGVDARVDVMGNTPMKAEVKDKPLFMPVNVDGRGGKKAGSSYPIKGTHAIVSTTTKCDKQRILTFIQAGNIEDIKKESEGIYMCGDWKIEAVMSPDKMANLKIVNRDGSVSFLLKDNTSGETVLREKISGKMVEKRVVDELPYHARGVEYISNVKK